MRAFLIITFTLLAVGFVGLFYYVQHNKPKNIIEENQKQASQLSLPYKNNNSDDVLTTPAPQTDDTFGNAQTQPQNQTPTNADVAGANTTTDTSMGELMSATKATIKTSKGNIIIELYPDIAPKTVSNFAKKAKSNYYNNLIFHRVEDWVVQGGDPTGNGTGGGNMPTEFNDKPFTTGAVGVARRNDPTVQNDSQFFIVKNDATWLNKQYTNFGMVTEGMDVVNKMEIGDKILSISVE